MTEAEHARLEERLAAVLRDVDALKVTVHEIELHGTTRSSERLVDIQDDLESLALSFANHREREEERERVRNETQQAEWRRNRTAVVLCILAAALSFGFALLERVIVK